MQKIRVTEIELPSCEHLRYIWFNLPNCVEKGGYVAVGSYNSYFCGRKKTNRRNHGPKRLYVARQEDEIDYYFPDTPIIEVETIWDFYKLIGFDYKRNKYMKYGLYATQGQGSDEGPDIEFDTLAEALAHVDEHVGEASFGIKYPNGEWHQWTDEDQRQAAKAMVRKNPPPGFHYDENTDMFRKIRPEDTLDELTVESQALRLY